MLEDRTVPTYFGASGGESIAIGPVMSQPGPGPNDVITGTGPGVPGEVRITTGNLRLLQEFYPFGTSFEGGIYVATGDVTGDGTTDLVVSSGAGMSGTVNVYEFINGGMQLVSSFTPFGVNYTSGVNIAVGNVTGDIVTNTNQGNANQIVVGMAKGGSTVQVYGYDDNSGTPQYDMLSSFVAYGPTYTGGVTLATATIDTQVNTPSSTINHDYASIITGMASGLPEVAIWNAQGPTVLLRAAYMAFNTQIAANHVGINVAAGDTDGQRGAQIYVNAIGTGVIRVFAGQTSAIITTFQTYPPQYATAVNMAVGRIKYFSPVFDDMVAPAYYVRDLVVVAANTGTMDPLDNSVEQIPVDLPGVEKRPAGLNGSYAL
jgi:hypothetical protein